MSENGNRLNVVKNTLLACRTNDPDEAAIYIELIEKVNGLIHYHSVSKRIDQWVDEFKDCETQAATEEYHAEHSGIPAYEDDLFRKLFPKGFPYGA